MPVLREANHESVGVAVLSDWYEDALRHKYDPLPEEGPRHKKKVKKKHVRSDHKHEYETVCVDAHSFVLTRGVRRPYMYFIKRCKVCGRIGDVSRTGVHKPPEYMLLYEVDDWLSLWTGKVLPEEKRVK